MECIVSDPEDDGSQLTGSVQPYVKENDRIGWNGAGEQGLQHALEQRDSVGLIKKPKVLERLKDLPRKCWTEPVLCEDLVRAHQAGGDVRLRRGAEHYS